MLRSVSRSLLVVQLWLTCSRSGRDRTHHWRIAYASAKEVDVHLQLLLHTGAIDHSRTREALELFDSVRAMTWRLIHLKK
ncbi:MAG: four helix bundle protein [bacterium]|nr:four helix bundle protein [bacterium]